MNDDFKELENELRGLVPARPSKALDQKLEQALSNRPQVGRKNSCRHIKLLLWPAGLAAAAACIVLVYILPPREAAQPKPDGKASNPNASLVQSVPPRYTEVESKHVLYNAQEEGIFFPDQGAPARRMRYRFLDSYTWKNPEDGSSIRVEVPREEIILVRLDTI